jgi:hypothetical protein
VPSSREARGLGVRDRGEGRADEMNAATTSSPAAVAPTCAACCGSPSS